jgi:transcription elongation factor Elf1
VSTIQKSVRRCLACGHETTHIQTNGRFVTASCHSCSAIFRVEFDPPDAPHLRARNERLDDAN